MNLIHALEMGYTIFSSKGVGKQPDMIDRIILNVSDYQSGPAGYVFPQLLACE